MVRILRKPLLLACLLLSGLFSWTGFQAIGKSAYHLAAGRALPIRILDTAVGIQKKYVKICSCQILELQSNNRLHKNIALFAEKSNGRNLVSDMRRVTRVLEKEKIHMQSLFYDKLTVVNAFTESTDCHTLYVRLKKKNKYLILYDILDADIRK